MSNSFVDLCLEESIENSKCVVSQFRTTIEQKNAFEELLVGCKRTHIPIEWVIDIADESNGWFYGTAYHYDDVTKMLHVMVPDKTNPSFDGQVILDYRTVHLIECVDGKSDALFNKIVRDSIIKIKWELEWFEEDVDENGQVITDPEMNDESKGKWIPSAARYFIRMANQLLVEDKNITTSTLTSSTATTTENTTIKGYVMLTADLNVKLITCSRNRGLEDFNRLVTEGITAYSDEAYETVMMANEMNKNNNANNNNNGNNNKNNSNNNNNNPTLISLRKLTDISSGLKDSVTDLLEEREKLNKERFEFADFFQSFTMNGDLDAGLKLMNNVEYLLASRKNNNNENNNENSANKNNGSNNDATSAFNALAEETNFHMQNLEKGMVRLLQQTSLEANNSTNNNDISNDEIEVLRRMQKQMKQELDEKEREIKLLKSYNGGGNSIGSGTSEISGSNHNGSGKSNNNNNNNITTTPQKPPKSPRNEATSNTASTRSPVSATDAN